MQNAKGKMRKENGKRGPLVRTTFLCLVVLTLHPGSWAGDNGLTIYNQNFAVVRQTVSLNLKSGVNMVHFTETTAHLEPESVILRDPLGRYRLQILEQNYRADPVSQQLLLSLFEGQTIDFLLQRKEGDEIVRGKIIRSGYVPHQAGWQRYGQQYYATQMAYMQGGAS